MFAKVSYDDIVSDIMNAGIVTSPRGEKTYELLNAVVQFEPGTMIERKGMNENLGWLEALMMVSGTFDIECIKEVAPRANHSLYEYQSDYGPRIHGQVSRVIDELREDKDSRRAIIYLNNRHEQAFDLACTTSLHFLIRNGLLYTTVNMRSWDVVYGMPMDIMMFSMMAYFVATLLGVGVGRITVNAASFHLYEKTRKLASSDNNQLRLRWTPYNVERFRDQDPIVVMSEIAAGIPNFIRYNTLPLPLLWIEHDEKPFEFSYGVNVTVEGRG